MSNVAEVGVATGAATPPALTGARGPSPTYTFSQSLVMLSRPTGETAESIRALRTHIVAQHVELGRRALVISGVNSAVGCSFTAANLAISLAQIGLKTLLIDANLRSPGIDKLIVASRATAGLAQCLVSPQDNLIDYIGADVTPNLSVMFAGQVVADAQTLLAKERFKTVVDFCLRDFDVTIVDTPPANSCADSRLVGAVVGYSLIVARQGRTFVDDVKVLVSQLQSDNARVVGTVLNQA